MPVALMTVPWGLLIALAIGARFLAPAWRAGLWQATRRALAAYAFLEIVPLLVAIVLKVAFDIGGYSGMAVYLMALMGVLFSGLVLCVFIGVALGIELAWRWGRHFASARRPA